MAGQGLTPTARRRRDRWTRLVGEVAETLDPTERECVYEAAALRDWQAHPEDWPRDRWPPNPADPLDLPEPLLRSAAIRIRVVLARAGTAPRLRHRMSVGRPAG